MALRTDVLRGVLTAMAVGLPLLGLAILGQNHGRGTLTPAAWAIFG